MLHNGGKGKAEHSEDQGETSRGEEWEELKGRIERDLENLTHRTTDLANPSCLPEFHFEFDV